MQIPKNLREFQARFATEAACVGFLRKRRWPEGFVCPRCGGREAWELHARPLDQCKQCGRQVSLTAGTLFHGTRKPLQLWFQVIAAFLTSKGGCSALEVARLYDLNYETAWTWLHKIRSLMDRDGVDKLNDFLELEGVPFRDSEGSCAVLAVAEWGDDEQFGRIRVGVVAALTAGNISTFLQRVITPNAAPLFHRFGVGHGGRCLSSPTAPPRRDAVVSTRRVRRVLQLLWRLLAGTYHLGMQARHLKSYADEFVFRFNRRKSHSRFLLFDRLIDSAFRRVPTTDELFTRPPAIVGT